MEYASLIISLSKPIAELCFCSSSKLATSLEVHILQQGLPAQPTKNNSIEISI